MPEDVSVVGYDNMPMAQRCDPPLTTLEQPFSEMGRVAARHLLAAASRRNGRGERAQDDTPNRGVVEELLPPRLVIRDSTGPAPLTTQK
jgi:DNA-binding LacI/PurR family transcriptional regulator